ncbi:MAG: TolB protein [Rickettsiales bacterium]|jgi:TolB protein
MKNIINIFLLFLLLLSPQIANAVNFKIDSRDIPKTKILVNATANANSQNQNAPRAAIGEILSRIKNNLQSTDLFEIVQRSIPNSKARSDNDLSIENIPDFAKYNSYGVGMILIMDVKFNQDEELEIKMRLWDSLDERQIFGKFYSASNDNYKKLANLISDEIFKAGTGETMGNFDSKIVYISESGRATKRVKRIVTMDFDGENSRYLTSGRDLVLTPIFSQKNEILFVRFFGSSPQIYNLDTRNMLVRKVGGFRGTTFAPNISRKNPNLLAFSMIKNGNSNIYQMNLFTNQIEQLTNSRSINTTPSYSPDGSQIVFSSDRSGSEQLYIMNSNGGSDRKIRTERGSYSKPMWSPDGRSIAFTRLRDNLFNIGIIDADGRNQKNLTSGYLVEGAKWSPSGRYIIYSRKNGAYGKASIPKLWIIDVLTGFERELPTNPNEGATDPDWIMN